ncbi:MAG: hypothetical protein GXO75_06490, partial [Calditrichaeota bacterium]|nr:hypothetical protein [Calditrichota bacterium]
MIEEKISPFAWKFILCLTAFLMIAFVNAGITQSTEKAKITVVYQDFSNDPGWEGVNNRVECENCPVITQNFGWVPTNRTGSGPGEIGGIIWRSTTPAYYAMPIGPLTFKDKFSALGKLAVIAPSQEGFGFYIGFFNDERQGWRVWSSCGFRIGKVINGKAKFHLDYKTGLARGAILNPDLEIPCDGSVHTWELIYDPEATVAKEWPDPLMAKYMKGVNNMRESEILERAKKVDPTITLERLQKLLFQARDAGLVDDWYRKGRYHLWTFEEEAPRMKGRITF